MGCRAKNIAEVVGQKIGKRKSESKRVDSGGIIKPSHVRLRLPVYFPTGSSKLFGSVMKPRWCQPIRRAFHQAGNVRWFPAVHSDIFSHFVNKHYILALAQKKGRKKNKKTTTPGFLEGRGGTGKCSRHRLQSGRSDILAANVSGAMLPRAPALHAGHQSGSQMRPSGAE